MRLPVTFSLAWFVMQSQLLQDGRNVIKRAWDDYLNKPYAIGNIKLSATSVVLGVIVFAVTLVVARSF